MATAELWVPPVSPARLGAPRGVQPILSAYIAGPRTGLHRGDPNDCLPVVEVTENTDSCFICFRTEAHPSFLKHHGHLAEDGCGRGVWRLWSHNWSLLQGSKSSPGPGMMAASQPYKGRGQSSGMTLFSQKPCAPGLGSKRALTERVLPSWSCSLELASPPPGTVLTQCMPQGPANMDPLLT